MRIAVLLLFIAVLSADANAAEFPTPWPCSQCTNGWVDRMTGMCPYRPECKPARRSKHRSGYAP